MKSFTRVITARVTESMNTESGYIVLLSLDNGITLRHTNFSRWETAMQWIGRQSDYRLIVRPFGRQGRTA